MSGIAQPLSQRVAFNIYTTGSTNTQLHCQISRKGR